ncbi:alpha-amylase family protein [Steroidobacter cummioxidans]|uniref:alpha-amylase family protein n=1 Tax=Steroidobacter cummioxidans TaxID=1803913 RepID=UPI000E3214EF|nr:alpha-amylase family protein [Steroidobacter cummioxidans]
MIEDLWYKNSIIYSLDLDTFMDANGDGTGDLPGLINRLDYLNSLGIDVIWLAPFQPSPNRDNGYDICDYYGVDPRYGSSGDFVEFMNHARKRGMRVILDLVVNHTSNEHPWFKEARRNPDSQYRDWYLWSKRRPAGWNKGMVFPGAQKAVWTRDPVAKLYYHHRFYDFQPDLNMDNPHVRAEIRRIMGYWLQLGVDGFRVDAVPFILESRLKGERLRFEYLAEMRQFLQWRAGDAALLGEANVAPQDTQRYFGDGRDGLNMMFNFWVNQHCFYALATGDSAPLEKALKDTSKIPDASQWAVFLRNHDELDIDRLPKHKRDKVFERFGPERNMQLYHRGIRRRLASMLGDRRHIELANSLMFALPGSPVLRYGDEIGMGEDLSLKERGAVRTPMQWSGERNGGFSTARKLVNPVISKGPFGYQTVNVDAQRRDPGSLLNWMIRMIRVRKECPEIGWGEWSLLRTGARGVLALCYSWRGNRIVVLHNFNRQPQQVKIALEGEGSELLVNLLERDDSRVDKQGHHLISLTAFGYKWFRVGGMNYALRRQPATPPSKR